MRDFNVDLTRILRADRGLHLAVFAYAAVVLCASVIAGEPHRFQPLMYASRWLMALPVLLSVTAPAALAVAGIVRNPAAPLQGFFAVMGGLPLARIVAGLLLFSSVTLFYGTFTSAKNLLPAFFNWGWDPILADTDDALHFGTAPWLWKFETLSRYTAPIDVIYGNIWFVLMILTVFWFCVAERAAKDRKRFFLVFFASWIVLGNVLAGVFLSGGPIFYDRIVGDAERFAPLVAHLAAHGEPALSVQTYQLHLWQAFESGRNELGSGISAFPSMHLAMATLMAIAWMQISRWLLPLAVGFVTIIQIGSVHLAWHYAIDGYASIVFVVLLWWVTGRLLGRTAPSSTQHKARLPGS